MGDYGNLEDNEPEYTNILWTDDVQRSINASYRQMTLTNDPLTQVVDLFCGGGGFTEGAINAGACVVLAVDCWLPAIEIHRANHPKVPCLNVRLGGSIEEVATVIRFHLTSGAHFHLHGSPPCQNISNASNGNPEDGMVLVRWFLDLVEHMKPDSWSMENVVPVAKRLPTGTAYVKLNSADFGVPQTRNRIFAGEGWTAKESHAKDEWVSVLDALPHLEGELNMTTNKNIRQRNANEPMRTITSKTASQTRIVSRRRKAGEEPQSYTPDKPSHTITQVQHIIETNVHMDSGRSSSTTCGVNPKTGEKEGGSGFLSRSITQPSYTVVSSPKGLVNVKNRVKATKIRSLTIQETAILQGFSPDMKLPYKLKKDAWTVIGNAVCPAVAEAIIRGIL